MHRWIYLAALLFALPAHAQFNACSQTVGTAAAPVPFVANQPPRHYVEICNAHATNTVGVNVSGGTAAIGAAGTRTHAGGRHLLGLERSRPGSDQRDRQRRHHHHSLPVSVGGEDEG